MHYNIRSYLLEAPQGDGDFFGFAAIVGDNGVELCRINEFFEVDKVLDAKKLYSGLFLLFLICEFQPK
jgi:hypothetical protein